MIDAAEELAVYLHAAGVAPTESAIRAALRPPRAVDVDRVMARGYIDACAAWGRPVCGGAGMLEGETSETMKPRGMRR